jgi:hypothetical protein
MGARRLQPPEGYSIAMLDNGEYVILITPRNERGNLINFGVVFDPDARRAGMKLPATFRRRQAAINYAVQAELLELRREVRRYQRGATNALSNPSNYATSSSALAAPDAAADEDDSPLDAA